MKNKTEPACTMSIRGGVRFGVRSVAGFESATYNAVRLTVFKGI
jgi:hypothetical protein